jgi:hypothetical protein
MGNGAMCQPGALPGMLLIILFPTGLLLGGMSVLILMLLYRVRRLFRSRRPFTSLR